jgi:type IV pilus assembly protein PilM
MARKTIGLDIGTRAVRLAELHANGEPTLSAFGRLLLPPGVTERGEVYDPVAVGQAITTLRKRLGLKGRSVHVGMANRRVIVRTIDLPAVAPEDLDGVIRYQAAEHLPIPLDQAILEYDVLEGPTEDGKMRILVVAAERVAVESLIAAVSAAGLEVATLELNAYPLARALAGPSEGTEVLVDVGAGVTTIVVHRDGKVRFARVLPSLGGDDFTQAITQSLEVDVDEAERLKRQIDRTSDEVSHSQREKAAEHVTKPRSVRRKAALIAAPGATGGAVGHGGVDEADGVDSEETGSSVEHGSPAEVATSHAPEDSATSDGYGYSREPVSPERRQAKAVREAIKPVSDRLTSEVRSSVDFYMAQSDGGAIDRVVVTGGGALLKGFSDDLAASLHLPVEHGRPFQGVRMDKVKVSEEELNVAEPFMGVAIGLALAGARR